MSSTILGAFMAVKLKNGKTVPFVLSAESNVRNASGGYDWRWHNIYVDSCNNFMFDCVEELQPKMKVWADSGSVKFRNGRFVTAQSLTKRLANAFAFPFSFENGPFVVEYIKLSEDRKKATNVTFYPKTEEEFLIYMDEHKDEYCHIRFTTREEN